MVYDKSQTIQDFLTAAAAKQPTPGGGSIAALAGALAASMGEMVVNYSIGKKDLVAHQDELSHALSEFTRARAALVELMVEDQAAYEALTAARKLPSGQKAAEYATALNHCIQIPQTIGVTAVAILRICDRMVEKVNKYLLSDLAVCAELAMATVRCAGYNVRVNLPELPDPADRKRQESVATKQIADCGDLIRSVISRIWAAQGFT